jgi:hypothetical protein
MRWRADKDQGFDFCVEQKVNSSKVQIWKIEAQIGVVMSYYMMYKIT